MTVLAIGLVSAVSQLVVLQAQAPTPLVPVIVGMTDSVSVVVLVAGQSVIFLTTIIGLLASWFRENRNRRWDLEDRSALAVKVQSQVDHTRMALHDKTEEVRVQTAQQAHKLIQKIDENTEISRGAFAEANAVNLKLLEVKQEIARLTNMFLTDTHQREEFYQQAAERKSSHVD